MKKTPKYCMWDRCKKYEKTGNKACEKCVDNLNNPFVLKNNNTKSLT